MNEISLSDEISIRNLQISVREQWNSIQSLAAHIDKLTQRLNQMDPTGATVGNAYTTPEGWAEKQNAVEAKCCGHNPQTIEDALVGKAWREDSSLEKWFPITAEELKNLRDHWPAIFSPSDASDNPIVENAVKRIMNSLAGGHYDQQHVIMLKRIHSLGHQGSEFPVDTIAAWVRQGVEYAVEKSTAEPKWRDARTDPPTVNRTCLAWCASDRMLGIAVFNKASSVWTAGEHSEVWPVTHWQELPAPPPPT